MGSTFGDYDGDGDLDWFVTSIWDPLDTCSSQNCGWGITGNRLYRNDGGRSFGDATDAAGVRAGFWGWGAAFFDADNDGDLDLVMTNGVDFPLVGADAAFNADPMRYWENDGSGNLSARSAQVGLVDVRSGKGLAVLDYDEDGDLDLMLANTVDGGLLYRNDGGNANDWLRIKLRDRRGNFRGLGAKIRVQAVPGGPVQVREMGAASHFLGQSEAVAHFGLGAPIAEPVHEVTIAWLGGSLRVLNGVARNGTLVVWRHPEGCGLLGIEPLLVLVTAHVLRRGRRRRAG